MFTCSSICTRLHTHIHHSHWRLLSSQKTLTKLLTHTEARWCTHVFLYMLTHTHLPRTYFTQSYSHRFSYTSYICLLTHSHIPATCVVVTLLVWLGTRASPRRASSPSSLPTSSYCLPACTCFPRYVYAYAYNIYTCMYVFRGLPGRWHKLPKLQSSYFCLHWLCVYVYVSPPTIGILHTHTSTSIPAFHDTSRCSVLKITQFL